MIFILHGGNSAGELLLDFHLTTAVVDIELEPIALMLESKLCYFWSRSIITLLAGVNCSVKMIGVLKRM